MSGSDSRPVPTLPSSNFLLKYRYFADAGLRREMKYESMKKMFSRQERCYCILDVKMGRCVYVYQPALYRREESHSRGSWTQQDRASVSAL